MLKEYVLDTIVDLGEHQGKTVREVLMENPENLNWLALNHKTFYVDPITRGVDFRSVNSQFNFSKEAREKMDARFENHQIERDIEEASQYEEYEDYSQSSSEIDRDYRWAMTDGIPGAGSIDDFG